MKSSTLSLFSALTLSTLFLLPACKGSGGANGTTEGTAEVTVSTPGTDEVSVSAYEDPDTGEGQAVLSFLPGAGEPGREIRFSGSGEGNEVLGTIREDGSIDPLRVLAEARDTVYVEQRDPDTGVVEKVLTLLVPGNRLSAGDLIPSDEFVDSVLSQAYVLGNDSESGASGIEIIDLRSLSVGEIRPLTEDGGVLTGANALACIQGETICLVAFQNAENQIGTVDLTTGVLIDSIENPVGVNGDLVIQNATAFVEAVGESSLFEFTFDPSTGEIGESSTMEFEPPVADAVLEGRHLVLSAAETVLHVVDRWINGETPIVASYAVNTATLDVSSPLILSNALSNLDAPSDVSVVSSASVPSRDILFIGEEGTATPLFEVGIDLSGLDGLTAFGATLASSLEVSDIGGGVNGISVFSPGTDDCGDSTLVFLAEESGRRVRTFQFTESSDSTASGLTEVGESGIGLGVSGVRSACVGGQVLSTVLHDVSRDLSVVSADAVASSDADGDGVRDGLDNCTYAANADQADADQDGLGDTCDDDSDGGEEEAEGEDTDGDGVADSVDNCLSTANADQVDLDGDGAGDECEEDDDGDGVDGVADCNDSQPLIFPDAQEFIGDGQDSDCDHQQDIIETLAGNGSGGDGGDGGDALSSNNRMPRGLALNAMGDVFFVDQGNYKIRKVSTAGIITTVAGTGVSGYSGDGGLAVNATFNTPTSIAFDSESNFYVTDTENNVIRRVAQNGRITTIAGTGVAGYSGDGGAATSATLNSPTDIAIDAEDNIYFTENGNSVVRKISTDGTISTVAGTGVPGFSGDGGLATLAQLSSPEGIALDDDGAIYIADNFNRRIRKVDTDGVITTFAGSAGGGFRGDENVATEGSFDNVLGLAIGADGALYAADGNASCIWKISSDGIVSSVIGTDGAGGFSGDSEAAEAAELNAPYDIAVDSGGNFYFSDSMNFRIRWVDL